MHQPLNTSTIHPLAMKPFTLTIFFALLTAYSSYIISPLSASLSVLPPSTVAYESCKRSYALERHAQECLTMHIDENPINQNFELQICPSYRIWTLVSYLKANLSVL